MQVNIRILTILIFLQIINFSQNLIQYPGFPRIINNSYSGALEVFTPLVADIDKDGQKEIITIVNALTGNPILYVIKNNGENYPNFPKYFTTYIWSSACGDINGDGSLEIVLRTSNSILAIDRFGNNLQGFPAEYPFGTQGLTYITLYDLDNDGKLEIFSNSYNWNNGYGNLLVYNYNGQLRTGWPVKLNFRIMRPAIGDIDNDGLAEIILAYSNKIDIYRHDGSSFANIWPVIFDSQYTVFGNAPSLFLYAQHPDSSFICITSFKSFNGNYLNRLEKYNLYGQLLNRAYSFNSDALGIMVMGDINNDGKVEFVTGDQYGENLKAYSNDLQLLPGWPKFGKGEYESLPVIGKLGPNMNILAGFDISGSSSRVYGYDVNGVQLSWSPIAITGRSPLISLADINSDGVAEIVVTSTMANMSILDIWSVTGTVFNNDNFQWTQYCHDRYRTNQYKFIPPDDPIGVHQISTNIPKDYMLEQNYPNPFNASTIIRFSIPSLNKTHVLFKIYDILGREIETLVNQLLSGGIYEVNFDANNYSSGVYLYILTASNQLGSTIMKEEQFDNVFVQSKKMLLVK